MANPEASASSNESASSSPGGGLTIALAWLAVGLPLLWGVVQTFKKALALFH